MSDGYKETILFKVYSPRWEKYMPVTLIHYDNGSVDIHCQTGDHHEAAMNRARRVL
jgi:hypothetical protein